MMGRALIIFGIDSFRQFLCFEYQNNEQAEEKQERTQYWLSYCWVFETLSSEPCCH